jgi:hypothetical protein
MKTLNEQVTRIKQMMGINESEIDLNTYKEETPILQDIKREGTSGEGNPIISMVVNTYIPYNDDVNGDYKSGQSVKIKVVTEWKVYHTTHYRTPRETFSIKKCLDVTSDVNLTDNVIGSILIFTNILNHQGFIQNTVTRLLITLNKIKKLLRDYCYLMKHLKRKSHKITQS